MKNYNLEKVAQAEMIRDAEFELQYDYGSEWSLIVNYEGDLLKVTYLFETEEIKEAEEFCSHNPLEALEFDEDHISNFRKLEDYEEQEIIEYLTDMGDYTLYQIKHSDNVFLRFHKNIHNGKPSKKVLLFNREFKEIKLYIDKINNNNNPDERDMYSRYVNETLGLIR